MALLHPLAMRCVLAMLLVADGTKRPSLFKGPDSRIPRSCLQVYGLLTHDSLWCHKIDKLTLEVYKANCPGDAVPAGDWSECGKCEWLRCSREPSREESPCTSDDECRSATHGARPCCIDGSCKPLARCPDGRYRYHCPPPPIPIPPPHPQSNRT